MDIRNLRIFLEVAGCASVSRAATQLAVSPSSVSKAITALELELSTRLFERTGRGVVLTAAGQALQPRAESVIAAMDGIHENLSMAGAPVSGVVRLGIQPAVSWPLVADLLDGIGHTFPSISLDIYEGTAHQIDEWLVEGRCQIGLLSRRPSPTATDTETLLRLPLLLIGRAGCAETAQGTISFEHVARLPLLLANAPSGARPLLEEHARRRNLNLHVVHNINSAHLKLQLVARGRYFTIATAWSNRADHAALHVSAARIIEPEIELAFHLAVAGKRKPSEAVQVVVNMVKALARTYTDASQPDARGNAHAQQVQQ